MKKVISLIILICMLMSAVPAAAKYSVEDGTLTFSGEGNVYGVFPGKLSPAEQGATWWSDAVKAEKIVFESGITGTSMSFNFASAKEIVLGDTFATLEFTEFSASKLEKITVDENNPYFASVDGVLFSKDMTKLIWYPMGKTLESYVVPDGVTQIGKEAFSYNSTLKKVTLPESCSIVDERAFNATNIEKIDIPGCMYINDYAFANCEKLVSVILPEGIVAIGNYAFESSGITTLLLPGSVTYVGDYAFAFCDKLTKVVIKEGVGSISNRAFSGCGNLTEIDMPDAYVDLGSNAFTKAVDGDFVVDNYLVKASGEGVYTVPEGVEYVASYAFSELADIKEIIIPDNVKGIGKYCFENSGVEKITIGKNVEYIELNAFEGCNNLAEIVISEENESYIVTDDGLYTKDKTILLKYMGGKRDYFDVPEGIEIIAPPAFEGAEIKKITIPDSTKTLGAAFKENKYLEEISIGSGVKELLEEEFAYCENLKRVKLSEGLEEIGVYSFRECSNLEEIALPDSVAEIGESAFVSCEMLRNVTLGSNLKKIDNYAFRYSGIETVVIPDSVTVMGDRVFMGCRELSCAHLGSGLTDAGEATFWQCENLQEVTGGENLTVIREYMFRDCKELKSFTMGDKVEAIEVTAFVYCNAMEEITVGKNVKSLDTNAISYCDNLKKVYIGDKVEDMGSSMFSGCSLLTEIIVDEENSHYKTIEGSLYTKDGKTLLKYVGGKSEFYIPDSVETIKDWAVYNNDTLESVIVPGNVKRVGDHAFRSCKNLKSITFEEGVEEIGSMFADSCPKLEEIYMPSTLKKIGVLSQDFKSTVIKYSGSETDWNKIQTDAFENINNLNVVYNYTDIKVAINGQEVDFALYGQFPVIENGRTLVPLRSVFEALGASVNWDDSTKTVTAVKENIEIKLTVGSDVMYVDGEAKNLDVSPCIKNDRTMVPVRAVAEAFGCSVSWNDADRTVIIE